MSIEDNVQKGISRNNHYVPQFYLQNWGEDNEVWTYELLVAHENVPLWTSTSIERTASIENLYVRVDKVKELDDFEKMFNSKYENLAANSLYKANNDMRLTVDDWEKMIDYTAAQIVRTPAFYVRLQPVLLNAFNKGMEDILEEMKHIDKDMLLEHKENAINQDRISLPINFERTGKMADENHEYIQISGTVGKSTWFWAIENSLLNTLKKLHQYRWSILICDESIELPTSDNPVVCINHFSKDMYDFFGVIGRVGNEIIFPVSPQRALYLQIGKKHPPRIKLNTNESIKIKQVIVENAFRYVYSHVKDAKISEIRPRIVDLDTFLSDKKMVSEWYELYKTEEGHYYD